MFAYALRDAVNEEMGSEAGAAAPADNGVKTGLYLAIQRVWEKATDAGACASTPGGGGARCWGKPSAISHRPVA